jgi:hypothetical protein
MPAKFNSMLSVVPPFLGGSLTCSPPLASPPAAVSAHRHLSPSASIDSELFVPTFRPKSNPCHSYKLLGGGGVHPRVHISLNLRHLIFPSFPFRARTAQRVHISLNLQHLVFTYSRRSNSLPAITYNDCSAKPLCAFTYENRGGGGYARRIRTSLNLRHLVFSASTHLRRLSVQQSAHRTNGHTAPFVSEWLARACASLNRSFIEFFRRDRSCAA